MADAALLGKRLPTMGSKGEFDPSRSGNNSEPATSDDGQAHASYKTNWWLTGTKLFGKALQADCYGKRESKGNRRAVVVTSCSVSAQCTVVPHMVAEPMSQRRKSLNASTPRVALTTNEREDVLLQVDSPAQPIEPALGETLRREGQ